MPEVTINGQKNAFINRLGKKYYPKNTPASVPVSIVANEAARSARSPNLEISPWRFGAIPPIPPICMAMELKLEKPHKENVAMIKDL
jgi:hypothetical protein